MAAIRRRAVEIDLTDYTIINIEVDYVGEKQVHFLGYGYFADEEDYEPFRFLEFTGFIVPLEYVAENGVPEDDNPDWGGTNTQYIGDHSYESLMEIYQCYLDEGAKILRRPILTKEMAPGYYILPSNKKFKRRCGYAN